MEELDTFANPNHRNAGPSFSIKKRPNEILLDQTKLKHQFLVNLGPNQSIPVYFPYEPYPIQVAYMQKVIEALETKQNALLQSPTGTGKTLCLLCASLSWLNYRRGLEKINKNMNMPIRLLYSSRTHAQLKQVVKELKTTVYKPFCTTIGSRDHYCVKREFMNIKGTLLNASCAKARKLRSKVYQQEIQSEDGIDGCKYYQTENEIANYTVPRLFNPGSIKGSDIMDIEDLKSDGKINKYCPYYITMKIINDVDILFLPYNYLLEKKLRDILKLSLDNTAIIFDEAHNIEQIAEDGSSYELSLRMLESALSEVDQLRELHHKIATVNKFDRQKSKYELELPETLRSVPEDAQLLQLPINNFLNRLKKILTEDPKYHVKEYSRDEKGILLETKDIFSFIETTSKGSERNYFELDQKKNPFSEGWLLSNLRNYVEILQKVIEDMSFTAIFGLDRLCGFLLEIFSLWSNYAMMTQNQTPHDWEKNRVNHYKLYIRNDPEDPGNVLLYLWCFSPALSFHDIVQSSVRNIILTSGTLAPFKSFEAETKLDYKIILSNPHIVNTQENLLAGIFQKGPQGNVFNFCFSNRDKEELFIDMGETFINLARQIPNGVLIVFASYQLLEKTYSIWSKSNILKRLEEIKPIIKEPKNSSAMSDRMVQYIKQARGPKGAILMAVCRGKIAEGIDFSDELARAVLMVGIPFPPLYDRRIELKQRYLDMIGLNRVDSKRRLSGKEWYLLQAIRAMNQAIGRVIRHKNDYGCVLFFDVRFNNSEVKKEISGWLRDEIKVFENFGHGYKEVLEFFRRKKQPTNAGQLPDIFKKSLEGAKPNNSSEVKKNLTPISEIDSLPIPFRPELKKVKQIDRRENNLGVADTMNELLALDFDNTTKNLPTSDAHNLDSGQPKSKSLESQNKSTHENTKPLLQNTDPSNSQQSLSDNENVNPVIKDPETTKKLITIQDLKTLRSRDDLRNCALTLESVEELESFKDFLNRREKFECMICLVNKDELFSSKCGHIACLECWKRWLKEKLVCPKCKARVREKTLIRVFDN